MTNFYRLSKKELSYISSIEEPLTSSIDNKRLSKPVVVVTYNNIIMHVWSLSWYRYKVKSNSIDPFFRYVIMAMY